MKPEGILSAPLPQDKQTTIMIWKPNVVVAAIIERDGRFLMVEEQAHGETVYNQPAGHLEEGENLVHAVIRETREETAWNFTPKALVGIYRWKHPDKETTYLRFCFHGDCDNHDSEQALDDGIIRAVWMSRDELVVNNEKLRSPMVLQCVDDYLAGQRYSLDMLHEFDDD